MRIVQGLVSIVSYVKKTESGWGVFSRKGKSLGQYKTKKEAVKRLRQVEYFKHHKS